jgi:TonB-dependent starch-binding outer membrane protein SusC
MDFVTKTLLAMRLTAILFFAGFLQVSARTTAQNVTYSAKGEPVTKVFAAIKAQTGYFFFYSPADLADSRPVICNWKDLPVTQALENLFAGQPLTYEIQGNTVVVTRLERPAVPAAPEPSPPENIHGRVTDSVGVPLAGASVVVKGTNKGVTTDANGAFVLKGVGSGVLLVSYTGYATRTYRTQTGKEALVVLVRSNSPLDQAQVIAYGVTTDRLSTSDITVVHAAEIAMQPVDNALAAIEGRVPGLFITQTSGLPGGQYNIQLRGLNSIQNGSFPFIVVDGVPYPQYQLLGTSPAGGGNPLDFINPQDIESISVLKDADATAIYGSRAASGAILITTKKGVSGKTRVDVNVQEGAASAHSGNHWMNTPQFLHMRHEAFANDSIAPTTLSAPDLLVWDTTRYTNWQKVLTGGIAYYRDAQASFSGGNTNTQYLLSGNYHKETTVFPSVGFNQNGAAHFSITNNSDDQRFKLLATGSYLINTRNYPFADLSGNISLQPDAPPIHNPDGSLNWANNTFSNNPYAVLLQKYQEQTNNLVGNITISYEVWKGLVLKATAGYNDQQTNETKTVPIASQDPFYNPTGLAMFTNNNLHGWIAEPQATYQGRWGLSRVDALLGSTFEENISNGQILQGTNYSSDALLTDPQAAPQLQITSYTNADYKYNALFGRISYYYSDKYILDLTARRDGSSRFGPSNQWHDFAAVGAAWIFSKEPFVQNALPFLSFGKFRGSYGSTGSDQIGDYQFFSLFNPSYYTYQGITTLAPANLSNPYLSWESTKKLEGALELGVLKDRIFLKANYYLNRSSNELLFSSLPGVTGFTGLPINLPAVVQNSGWELVLNTTNVKTRSFSWTTSINLTISRNKLASFPNIANSPFAGYLFVGKPLTTLQDYHLLGVDPQTGVYQFEDSKGNPTFAPSYQTDRISFFNTMPKYYGGIQNSVGLKGWALDVFFQFRNIRGLNDILQDFIPGNGANVPTKLLNAWHQPGDKTTYEKYTQNYNSAAFQALQFVGQSDGQYTNASFIRLSNLSLSYQFKASWLKKSHLEGLRMYIHAQNLLTISHYPGGDPETQSYNNLPPLRVITGGIQLTL